MANKKLVQFIKEARAKGYEDFQLRQILLKNKWPQNVVDTAFDSLKPKFKFKNRVELFISNEVLNKLQHRANKNMFTMSEQIEDILRRSTINQKPSSTNSEKLEDNFIKFFSRKG